MKLVLSGAQYSDGIKSTKINLAVGKPFKMVGQIFEFAPPS